MLALLVAAGQLCPAIEVNAAFEPPSSTITAFELFTQPAVNNDFAYGPVVTTLPVIDALAYGPVVTTPPVIDALAYGPVVTTPPVIDALAYGPVAPTLPANNGLTYGAALPNLASLVPRAGLQLSEVIQLPLLVEWFLLSSASYPTHPRQSFVP